MATEIVKTVKPSGQGGDYTTLAGANEGEVKNLVSADEQLTLQPAGDWTGVADTADTSFDEDDAWVTDETRFVKVEPDAANLAGWLWDEDKYVRRVSGADGVIDVKLNRMVVRGLQLHSDNAFRACVKMWRSGSHTTVDGNFCRALNQTQNSNLITSEGVPMTFEVINNICVGGGTGIFSTGVVAKDLSVHNNTVYDMSVVGLNIQFSTGTVNVKNNIVQSTTGANYTVGVAGGVLTTARNLGDDATSPDAAFRNKTVLLTSVGGLDFSLTTSDTEAKGQGEDLEGDADYSFTNAIGGTARRARWDIGAFQFDRTEEPGISIEVGTTLYMGGGVTAKGGAISGGTIKMEVYDEDDSLVDTLISVTGLVLTDDQTKSYGFISGPSVGYTFDTAGLFFVRTTVVNDNSETFTEDEAIRVGPISSVATDLRAQISSTDRGEVAKGATVTVVGGLTARNRDLADMKVKLELLNTNKSLNTTLIAEQTDVALTEDSKKTWATINGSAVTFAAPSTAGRYYLRATVLDAEDNDFTDSDVTIEVIPAAPTIGTITNSGTAVTVAVTGVDGTCHVSLKEQDGTVIDTTTLNADGDASLTLSALDELVFVIAQNKTGDAWSEVDFAWLFFGADSTTNEILAYVIDLLQADSALVALLASADDMFRVGQERAASYPQLTFDIKDDPDADLDDSADKPTVTLEVMAWAFDEDTLAKIVERVDAVLYDNRRYETSNWIVASTRRINLGFPAEPGFVKDSTAKRLRVVSMTFELRARKK